MTTTLARPAAALCACGCGEPAPTHTRKGRIVHYRQGHRWRRPPAATEGVDLRCARCGYPAVPKGEHAPPGFAKLHCRGLCPPCYQQVRNRGQLAEYQPDRCRRDDILDDWDWLRSWGVGREEAARRIGITVTALDQHLCRARRDGDPRAGARPVTRTGARP